MAVSSGGGQGSQGAAMAVSPGGGQGSNNNNNNNNKRFIYQEAVHNTKSTITEKVLIYIFGKMSCFRFHLKLFEIRYNLKCNN